MNRTTSLAASCGALVLPAILAGVGLIEAAQPAGSTHELQVTGRAGVPDTASAVVLNVTSANANADGYITAYPCGETRPNASNLNFVAGAPVANSAIVKVGAGGKVCLFNGDGATELIVDINGWFAAGSAYTSSNPARLLDTRRRNSTIDNLGDGDGMQAAGTVYTLPVTGRGGVPGNASAVVLNLTSAGAAGTGFVSAYPCGESRPNASSLNFRAGAASANSTIVKVGDSGTVCLFVGDADTQLIADASGWFTSGTGYTAATPARVLDTRRPQSTVDGQSAGGGARNPGSELRLPVVGRAGVPPSASAVALNLTSADGQGTGYVTAYSCDDSRPNASNLNFTGSPVANLVIVKLGPSGDVCLYTGDASTQLIADVNGWFSASAGFTALTPERLIDTRTPPAPPGTPPAGPSGGAFTETFTGNTGMERFRSGVYHRNSDSAGYPAGTGGSWDGDHDLSCGAPTTFRTIDARNRGDSLYMCKDHMMTSMGDVDGYSVVWFSPNETFTNISQVCWDVNLTNMGNRQWWEVAVQPVAAADLSVNLSWLSGASHLPPRDSAAVVGAIGLLDELTINDTEGSSYDSGTDKATRFQHCMVDNGNGTSTLTQQRPNGPASVTVNKAFPTGPVEVIFKSHAYTPDKSETSFQRPAYTWHWDNVTIG